jgi:hypothetical protein
MTNSINTIKSNGGVLAKLAAGTLVDNLQFCKTIGKADESDYNGKNGYSAGDTIYISKPARMVPTSSFDITSAIQGITEEKVALALNVISSVGIEVDSQELASTIAIGSIYNRAVKPAVEAIAQDVEETMLSRAALATANTVLVSTFDTDTMLACGEKLNNYLAPKKDRFALLSPAGERSAVNARKGLFQASTEIAAQYKEGLMGTADGFTYLSNNLMPRLTNGNDVTGAAIDDTVATGATTIHIDGITTGTGTVAAGSVFTIAGVNAVHPQTKADLGFLQQFVVITGGTASGTSDLDIVISPAIYSSASGSLQNVTALPADDAAIVFVGTASQTLTNSIVFNKDAFRMVSVPLVLPNKAELAVQETYKGMTVAIVRDFDVLKRRMITRVDFLGGFCAPRPEWACRAVI